MHFAFFFMTQCQGLDNPGSSLKGLTEEIQECIFKTYIVSRGLVCEITRV